LQRRPAVAAEHRIRRRLHLGDREQLRRRQAAGERDDFRLGGDFQDLADGRRTHLREAVGEIGMDGGHAGKRTEAAMQGQP